MVQEPELVHGKCDVRGGNTHRVCVCVCVDKDNKLAVKTDNILPKRGSHDKMFHPFFFMG